MVKRPVRQADAPLLVVGYCRVSTGEQAASGAGLAAQESAIRAEVSRRGWQLVEVKVDRGASGTSLGKRPALAEALAMVKAGDADLLVVSKLDRLSRSLLDFSQVMSASAREGWGVVCLDIGLDTATPSGELVAGVVATTAQYERRLISERTKSALAAKRAQGVRLGRPRSLPDGVIARIVRERAAGTTLRVIADGLNSDGIATAQGAPAWTAGTVHAVLRSQDALSADWGDAGQGSKF